jgi:hypothetical protein
MKRKQMLIWVGVVGVGALSSACCCDDSVKQDLTELKQWATNMYGWEDRIGKAVCNLESKTGTTTGDFYCGTGPYPPSDTPPPKYPPR